MGVSGCRSRRYSGGMDSETRSRLALTGKLAALGAAFLGVAMLWQTPMWLLAWGNLALIFSMYPIARLWLR